MRRVICWRRVSQSKFQQSSQSSGSPKTVRGRFWKGERMGTETDVVVISEDMKMEEGTIRFTTYHACSSGSSMK